ncbi:protein kinase [Coemansia sp. RSA 2052]|nr:protein kinase [Coemansia sp. RSA 2052]
MKVPVTTAADGGASAAEVVEIRVSSHLQSQNAQFQAEISALDPLETDDPLDVYHRYVQWLIEVIPQAVGHQAVIRLVERPLKLFRDQERYRNDARYVKMWIWYTGLVNEGQDAVFQYLIANKIGDSLAILYEEYGKLLESKGKVRKADEIYQLGAARKAQPLARLQRRYVEFQRRVMAQTMRDAEKQQQSAAEEAAAVPPPPHSSSQARFTDENSQRTMLGAKRTAGSMRSAAANTLPSSQRGLPSAVDVRGGGRQNSRIAVFSDPNGTSAAAASSASSATPWLDVGSDEGRRKENMREATSWRGQTLEQRRIPSATAGAQAVAAPVMEKFTVFSDDAASSSSGLQSAVAAGSMLSVKSAAMLSSSNLLQSFDDAAAPARGKPTAKAKDGKVKVAKAAATTGPTAERMIMPDIILFPAGDGIPQCAEEARAQLPQYRFDYDAWVASQATNDSDDVETTGNRGKRAVGMSGSPTINTRAAEQGMLDIWNDDNSDSDSESLLGELNNGPSSSSRGPSKNGDHHRASSSGGGTRLPDDDYQFTMGPVVPNIVPEELAMRPPVIPTSVRVIRRQEPGGVGASGSEDDMPTVVLNSIRTAKRQQMRMTRGSGVGGPTPLAMRVQTPVLARHHRDLRSIGEEYENPNGGYNLDDAELNNCTPAPPRQRLQVYSDETHPAPLQFAAGAAAKPVSNVYHSTPARNSQYGAPSSSQQQQQRPPAGSCSTARYLHTPGYTRTTTGFSVSGAELTGLSGFTGVSTIGGPTSLSLLTGSGGGHYSSDNYEDDDDDDYRHSGNDMPREHDRRTSNGSSIAPTPLRKRLSMAAKDFGKMTPRFPKTLDDDNNDGQQEYEDGDDDDVEDDDDDDDVEDEDDGEEPCTENIGEFADLDSQMNELEMQLGTKFLHRDGSQPLPASPPVPTMSARSQHSFQVFSDTARSPSPFDGSGSGSRQTPRSAAPARRQPPLFSIFQD